MKLCVTHHNERLDKKKKSAARELNLLWAEVSQEDLQEGTRRYLDTSVLYSVLLQYVFFS